MEEKTQNFKNAKGSVLASTRGLDLIITGSILLIFFLAPLFFTGLAAQGIGFEKIILFYFLVLIGVVAWVTKGVIVGELNLKRTPLDIPILATLAVFLVSTLLSVSAKDSLIGTYGGSAKSFVALLSYVLFYYLVVNNIDKKKIKWIFYSILSSASLTALYSLLQINGIFLLPLPSTKLASFNPMGSLSALTAFLVAVIPMLVVGVAQSSEISQGGRNALAMALKIVLGLFLLASLAVLFLLNGFTFWPVAILSMVIVLMFFLSKIIKISNNNLLIPLAIFLVFIIFLVLGNLQIGSLNLPAEVSLSRSASWSIAKSALKGNPFFGSGPATFYYDFSKFKSVNFNNSPLWNIRFDSATGSFFELLATVGILGILPIVVLALIALSLVFITLTKSKDRGYNSILLGVFASLISVLVYNLLFSQNNSMILFSVLLSVFSVSAALVLYPEKFKILSLSFRASAKYALALAAIFLCVSAGVVFLFTMGLKMYLGDVYARQSMSEKDVKGKIAKLEKAISLAPYQDSYYLNLANNYMALANQSALNQSDQASIVNNLNLAIKNGQKSVEIVNEKAANNESLALIYENASFYTRGTLELAEKHYQKVKELDPNNPTPYLRIALVNMAQANAEQDQGEKEYFIQEAIKQYDEAIKKKSDLAAAFYGKAIAYEKLNDVNKAIDNLKTANIASRNNANYLFELGRLYFNRGVSQMNLSQTASQQIAKNDISPDQGTSTESELSIEPVNSGAGTSAKNEDLAIAEQIFLSILKQNRQHANSLYSLAVLYQKTGDNNNARLMAQSLIGVVKDEQTKNAVRQQFSSILE